MNKSKIMVVALAATILASGGGIAGSVATATPAQAATVTVAAPTTAPIGLRTYPFAMGNMVHVMWSAPTNVSGTISSYTLTLKQAGKSDRILTTKDRYIVLGDAGELAENTTYTLLVKANIISKAGVKSTSPNASVQFKTSYALTTVKVSAPTSLYVAGATANSFAVSWKAPTSTVGLVESYTVRVKKGTTLVKTITLPANILTYKATSLASNTAYTAEVTANAISFRGGNHATSTATKVAVTTSKSSVVAVAKPVVTVASVATNTAKITWTKPAVTGQIRAYVIFVTEKGTTRSMKIGEYSGTTTSAQLQSVLKPNTTYTVSVVAMAHSEDGKNMTSSGTNVVLTTKR